MTEQGVETEIRPSNAARGLREKRGIRQGERIERERNLL